MRRTGLLLALALLFASCGDDDAAVTTLPTTTTTQATTAPTTTTTTTAATTTEGTTGTTTTVAVARAEFAITQVTFGENGFVAITNIGGGSGTLSGHWLCQRPNYFGIPDVTLGSGEEVWVATGDGAALAGTLAPTVVEVVPASGSLGGFSVGGGEIAFYTSRDFGNAGAILDFVSWGAPGFGRSSVAEQAGIWTDGGSVDVPADATAITVTTVPTSGPDNWTAGVSG